MKENNPENNNLAAHGQVALDAMLEVMEKNKAAFAAEAKWKLAADAASRAAAEAETAWEQAKECSDRFIICLDNFKKVKAAADEKTTDPRKEGE